MRSTVDAVLFAAGIFLGSARCKPADGPRIPDYCYDDDAFTMMVVECALKAPSREASRACRGRVHEACGIVMTVSSKSESP